MRGRHEADHKKTKGMYDFLGVLILVPNFMALRYNKSHENRFLALHYANKGRWKIASSLVTVHLLAQSTWQAVAS
ncbi:hypothetical protein T4C_11829 [Trichinella pseudospiralis]|uniref:Uncharacterized protein n=2 Tax=Trichinella pseudospiralis TaxID=6337 RepID=A0A0V1JVZ1_TRIPS|nr:hypothetical protein T4C_11829 [Trichinella pseudospiralis]